MYYICKSFISNIDVLDYKISIIKINESLKAY